MDAAAKVTSKGQVTVPKAVHEAIGIKEGDTVVFRVEGNRAVLPAPRPRAPTRLHHLHGAVQASPSRAGARCLQSAMGNPPSGRITWMQT